MSNPIPVEKEERVSTSESTTATMIENEKVAEADTTSHSHGIDAQKEGRGEEIASSVSDPGVEKAGEEVPDEGAKDVVYMEGVKLWLVVGSITLVCFLMLLDMSIVVTVSFDFRDRREGCS